MSTLHPHVKSLRYAARARASISLAELGDSALMERTDTKYLLTATAAANLVSRLPSNYRVLQIEGRRVGRYHTTYFDTADFALFHAHHAGRVPRHKVRMRCYLDSQLCFLELKRRNNRGLTTKQRIAVGKSFDVSEVLSVMRSDLRDFPAGVHVGSLRPVLDVDYLRLTLVDTVRVERVTIDLDLRLQVRGSEHRVPSLAVVEVKQGGARRSAVHELALAEHCRPLSFSKYCVGIALLQPGVKSNNYRATLRQLASLQRSSQVVEGELRDVA
jgi:VTC domain